jgi:FOG: FHA domain
MSAAPKLKEALKYSVEVVKGPHAGLKLSFAKESVSIGRGPENDIVLANDPRVSRHHAEIKQRERDFVIVNLSPKNFILVNGSPAQSELIGNNSVIQIGDCEIRFHADIPLAAAAPESAMPATPSVLQPLKPMGMPAGSPVPRPQQQMPPAMQNPHMPPAMPQQNYGMGPATSTGMGGQQPPPPRRAPASGGLLSNPRVRFYGIIAIIGVALYFFLQPVKKSTKDPNAIRTSELAMADIQQAQKNTEDLMNTKKEKYDTVQYRRAQENFIRGFRDYQQGQYARAREAFQVVLNLDPENELAKRYYHLSKIKFDEMVKFSMIQGNRYREKRNWRMCQSSYSVVMTMLQNRKDDPTFKEAKQFFEECKLNMEGRY